MAEQEQHIPGDEPRDVPAAGSEADASGPQASPAEQQGEELTVDDILGAEQTAEAADAEAQAAAEAALSDEEKSYLEDLRRLTAEYANYRKRTEANAVLEKQRAVAAAVTPLLSVLDDIDRAEQHGDLVEGSAFTSIAQKLRGTVERMGLESYGEKGEAFDPQLHEAIAQVPVPGTEEHVVLDVIERGYRIGDVELRPAKVAVAVGADG